MTIQFKCELFIWLVQINSLWCEIKMFDGLPKWIRFGYIVFFIYKFAHSSMKKKWWHPYRTQVMPRCFKVTSSNLTVQQCVSIRLWAYLWAWFWEIPAWKNSWKMKLNVSPFWLFWKATTEWGTNWHTKSVGISADSIFELVDLK